MTQEEIKRINGFYDVALKNNKIWIARKGAEKGLYKNIDSTICFSFGNASGFVGKEELDQLVKAGKCIAVSGQELLKDYFKVTDDEALECMRFNIEKRSLDYLNYHKNKCGLVSFLDNDESWKLIQDSSVYEKDAENICSLQSGRLEEEAYKDLYIIEYAIRYTLDDYFYRHFMFREKPTQEQFELADELVKIFTGFQSGKVKETYYAEIEGEVDYEAPMHWLDNQGRTPYEKFKLAEYGRYE